MSLALALHVLASTLWVGGMFFAFMCLRPVAAGLDTPVRLQLWAGILGKFFPWVWAAVAVLLASGFFMFFKGVRGMHVHLMMGIGVVMMLMAAHVFFAPFRRMRGFVAASNWHDAAAQLNQIRIIIMINLALGLFVVALASAGRMGAGYWA